MARRRRIRSAVRLVSAATCLASAGYLAYAGIAWSRYGQPPRPQDDEQDELLDRFMPAYEVRERHQVRVNAPAEIVFAVASEQDLMQSAIVRAIFRTRELLLGGTPDSVSRPHGLVDWCRSLGWGVLAEVPGREIVVGAVTRPWMANVVFRPIAAERFAMFDEPDYVRIAWTIRADVTGDRESLHSTETRVVTTDLAARARFRRYWALASPGIILIRRLSLGPLKREAERRAALGL
jgi:hypothetical protein